MTTLDRAAIAAAVGALDADGSSGARLAHAFLLAPDAALALVDLQVGGHRERHATPFVLRDGEVREAVAGDGAWRALGVAIATGRSIPALPREPGSPVAGTAGSTGAGPIDAALVCRPSPGFADAWGGDPATLAVAEETAIAGDRSTPPVVLGGRVVLKTYRPLEPGLNPDLELTAYLGEEAEFTGVPRLAGWVEAVTRDDGVATVAILQAYVADAADAYERTAEFLASILVAPGSVSMEWATEVAEDLGILVAGLHAALASPPAEAIDLLPRPATHDEIKTWRSDAQRELNTAIAGLATVDAAAGAELRREAAAITARLSRFEASATAPVVTRIHGDLHLGRILVAEDGYRIIGFEGDPSRPIEDRRRPDSPLRDVASLLRSLDHVAGSAVRRAEGQAGGPIDHPGIDIDAWIERSRERFLAAYADGLRRSGAGIALDPDLLDAFEVAREIHDLAVAAAADPSQSLVPREGMRRLLARGEQA